MVSAGIFLVRIDNNLMLAYSARGRMSRSLISLRCHWASRVRQSTDIALF
jgi:hypothetical protein